MLKPHFSLNRKGVAPLEMILALPVVAFLFVLILYVAVSCMQKYELDTLSRTKAWDARYTHQDSQQGLGQAKNLEVNPKKENAGPFFRPLFQKKISA